MATIEVVDSPIKCFDDVDLNDNINYYTDIILFLIFNEIVNDDRYKNYSVVIDNFFYYTRLLKPKILNVYLIINIDDPPENYKKDVNDLINDMIKKCNGLLSPNQNYKFEIIDGIDTIHFAYISKQIKVSMMTNNSQNIKLFCKDFIGNGKIFIIELDTLIYNYKLLNNQINICYKKHIRILNEKRKDNTLPLCNTNDNFKYDNYHIIDIRNVEIYYNIIDKMIKLNLYYKFNNKQQYNDFIEECIIKYDILDNINLKQYDNPLTLYEFINSDTIDFIDVKRYVFAYKDKINVAPIYSIGRYTILNIYIIQNFYCFEKDDLYIFYTSEIDKYKNFMKRTSLYSNKQIVIINENQYIVDLVNYYSINIAKPE